MKIGEGVDLPVSVQFSAVADQIGSGRAYVCWYIRTQCARVGTRALCAGACVWAQPRARVCVLPHALCVCVCVCVLRVCVCVKVAPTASESAGPALELPRAPLQSL